METVTDTTLQSIRYKDRETWRKRKRREEKGEGNEKEEEMDLHNTLSYLQDYYCALHIIILVKHEMKPDDTRGNPKY